jgi:hypothetical protein
MALFRNRSLKPASTCQPEQKPEGSSDVKALSALPAFAFALAAGSANAVTVDDVVAEAASLCASFENGAVTLGPTAVNEVELTGEGGPETVIDWSGIDCSTMASAWGGTGGSSFTVLIDGQRHDDLVLDWSVVDFGGPVLLLAQHGSTCGASGAERCVRALVWSGGKLQTVPPPVPEEAAKDGD